MNYRALSTSDQSYLPFLSFLFFFFFATWKSDGRANNNGEKSWTRSRDNKNLYDKDFFIRLERWDKSFVRKKKGERKEERCEISG